METIKFIDLFAGMGGMRLGFERAFNTIGFKTDCVLTSEIKPYAIETLKANFDHHNLAGDIFKIENKDIPDFDFLLGGFPCQSFSAAGKRHGFADRRGTLFFEIERILRHKQPYGFILENVEGLVKHDLKRKSDKIGETLKTILNVLSKDLKYKVSWKVLDSVDFGLPQSRKRVFIVGIKDKKINLNNFPSTKKCFGDIMEKGLPCLETPFIKKLLDKYTLQELYGKSIKDKRGGSNNIHSWDIGLKGEVTPEQVSLLNDLFKERRRKKWASELGITWMDGMPLTLKQIQTFNYNQNLKALLDDLVKKGYLRFEHPKKLLIEKTPEGVKKTRVPDKKKPKGYNIVTGKLSFEINKIISPYEIAPTLVATDVARLAVPDQTGLRRLTIREGLRLFGFPENYSIPVSDKYAFDLLGNTVAVPVMEAIASRIARELKKQVLPQVLTC